MSYSIENHIKGIKKQKNGRERGEIFYIISSCFLDRILEYEIPTTRRKKKLKLYSKFFLIPYTFMLIYKIFIPTLDYNNPRKKGQQVQHTYMTKEDWSLVIFLWGRSQQTSHAAEASSIITSRTAVLLYTFPAASLSFP